MEPSVNAESKKIRISDILQSISQNFCQNIPKFVPKFVSSLRSSKVHIEIQKPVCKQSPDWPTK